MYDIASFAHGDARVSVLAEKEEIAQVVKRFRPVYIQYYQPLGDNAVSATMQKAF